MLARVFLVAIGLLYLGLALWCSISPDTTSRKVGFELRGGSGQSEFMTVYGGLEFGMALVFMLAAFRRDWMPLGLMACFLIHASLVLFRTISLFRFEGLEPLTWKLAIGEWVIAIGSLAVWFLSQQRLS
jgi:hypothetical protein